MALAQMPNPFELHEMSDEKLAPGVFPGAFAFA